MAELFDQLLVACPNSGGLFYLRKGVALTLDGFDTTGLTIRGTSFARAIQPSDLALVSAQARDIDRAVARIDDLHDAYLDGDSCLVVSTHGNEVVEFGVDGEQRRRWAFPGEPDAWHINCVTRWNGRIVFSAFADRRAHRAYKQPPLNEGFVQDLESGARPITGLFQPHSLVADGDRLVLANSGAFELREYAADARLLRATKLDGYTRGVLRAGGVTYVGLSKTRNVDAAGLDSAVLVALDARTWKELGRLALPVDEIYSIQVLPIATATEIVAKLAAHANARLTTELASVCDARDNCAQRAEAAERTVGEVQRESERKIFGLLETVHGKDLEIQNRDEIVRGKDAEVARREALLQDKEAQLAAVGGQSREKDRQIFGLLETVHGKDLEIQNRDEIVRGKDAEVARRDALLQDKEAQLAAVGGQSREKDRQIFGLLEMVRGKDAQLKSLAQAVSDTSGRLTALSASLVHAHAQLAAREVESADRARALVTIQSTLSWRLTRPLRAVRRVVSAAGASRGMRAFVRPFRKLRHVSGTLMRTWTDRELRDKYLAMTRVLGVRGSLRRVPAYLRRGGPRPLPPLTPSVFDLRANAGKRAVILTTKHCLFVAQSIRHALRRVGVDAAIITERPAGGYENVPHFVICPQMFSQLPGLYVAFQMEQSVSTRWFTDAYLRMLENAFAIFDYSLANVEALVDKGLQRKQFFYLPLGYLPDYGTASASSDQAYDVVFYGDINNDRRRRFVAALEKVCRVKVFNDLFGQPLHAELAKAKLVVNIHYYEGALLETTRLWECVSLGKLVVSERAVNMDENRDLEPLVDFVDLNDVDGMVERVRHWLANEPARQARLKANRTLAARQANRFEYFFYRFLLAWDLISFHRFWELAGSKLTLSGDKLCLNLPEWFGRRRSFDHDNQYGFQVFPGLRHREGWIGCGLSYKLMIMLARKQRFPQITICEDDVEFHPGFAEDFAEIQTELAAGHERWDVFSGLLGDLHADAEILKVRNLRSRKLAHTNRLISTVFNVYHRSVFDRVSLWDDRDRDVVKNTIDRYLEHTRLSVLACYPFLVGHKEELHSTLWGIQNGAMADMIQRSQWLLGSKIEAFETGAKETEVASRPT